MANTEHLAILHQGVKTWNAWRKAHPNLMPDLQGVDLNHSRLSHADLSNVQFDNAFLRGADLHEATLYQTEFFGAQLPEANLANANLRGAKFHGTNLFGADLRGAHLYRVDFIETTLHHAKFNAAFCTTTTFSRVDLSKVMGLSEIVHGGPSHVDFLTLLKSRGSIPEIFLRGCGIPESFIEYLPSLIGALEPIQFYSCFISYSTKYEEFANRLHSKMREHNLRVWIANEDLKGGHKLREQIDEAIRVYDKTIIVLSPESLRSKWVMNEVRRTRRAELANNQRKFFPIALMDYRELEDWECIDPETGTDLAAEIREYYIPDFRAWKNHDSFERAFAQLLEGLKAVDEPPAPRIEPKITPKHTPQEPVKMIARLKQRLAILEEQAALYGIDVRPHILIEIQELREEITRLESEH
jgi:hypothetical protein